MNRYVYFRFRRAGEQKVYLFDQSVNRTKIHNSERKYEKNNNIQEPNGGPSPIPYGFEGRTGMGMGTMTGEVIVD